jgi:hypothetical protein
LEAIDPAALQGLPLPDEIKARVAAGTAELEELLDNGVQLHYVAWGYDRSTGAFAVARSGRIESRDQIRFVPPI